MPLSAVNPGRYDALLADKVQRVQSRFEPYLAPPPQVFPSPPTGYRTRAEFRVWHDGDGLDYVMFRPGEPHDPVPISDFPVACDSIQQLMWPLLARLRAEPLLRRKLFQVEFLSTLAGDSLVTLIYHRPLESDWERRARELGEELGVAVVGRSRRQKLVLTRDYVTETLPVHGRAYHYRQYEQAFTQPNARVNIHMIEWACAMTSGCEGDLLELYCGNGNFTLPLSRQFGRVIATELSKTAISATRHNIGANERDNIELVRLSAEEVSQAMAGTREFRRLQALQQPLPDYRLDTVFVDPPRAGLDPATVAMVAGFERILYISCNPDTLAANLAELYRSHAIRAFALFDQFPYTEHMECGVLLERKSG